MIKAEMANGFMTIIWGNNQTTTLAFDKYYPIVLFLTLAFAILLLILTAHLNKTELLSRTENQKLQNATEQQLQQLVKTMVIEEKDSFAYKIDALRQIVQLATGNSCALVMKYNEFDPGFSQTLYSISPDLLKTEIEFCILIRLNFDTQAIACYTETSVQTVALKKLRIRKKLHIPPDQDINTWMTNA